MKVINPDAFLQERSATPSDVSAELLDNVHKLFRRWFSKTYDTEALDAVLAAAAVQAFDGDPLWLMVISGPGGSKTETVQTLSQAGAIVTSTIASEGALLSGSRKKERAKTATGGLLKKIGASGLLIIKDFTSILSMNSNTRAPVLAALREVYDGRWERNIGTDGGQTLTWEGRITVIAATTTTWDAAHGVIAAMGDRFVLVRMDNIAHRKESGDQAISNTGQEVDMRAALADAVGKLLAEIEDNAKIDQGDKNILFALADFVTFARTAVDTDYKGEVIEVHAPEAPTRFAKQLFQLMRGGMAIGLNREQAIRLATRCAHDSTPPMRLAVIVDIACNPGTSTSGICRRLIKPKSSVQRALDGLKMLKLIKETQMENKDGSHHYQWTLLPRLNAIGLNEIRKIVGDHT